MLKRTIAYEDYNGNKHSEIFYFHLTEPELLEMEASYEGGYAEALQRIVDTEDSAALIAEMKRLVLLAYGEKSDDGKIFVKNPELATRFSQHAAYPALFMELAMDADAASAFMNGIIPKKFTAARDQDIPVGPPPTQLASPTPQAAL